MPGSHRDPPVEPAELMRLLAAHHVTGFDDIEQHLLAGRLCGGEFEQLSAVLHITPGALQNKFGVCEDVILKPLGFKRNESLTTHWFNGHLHCERHCLSHAKFLIENQCVYAIT